MRRRSTIRTFSAKLGTSTLDARESNVASLKVDVAHILTHENFNSGWNMRAKELITRRPISPAFMR